LRVAEKSGGEWVTHQWLKKAVLLSFRLEDSRVMESRYYDKVASKFESFDFEKGGFRVVPPASARRGAYIAKNVVLMPSFVNIGAYVDEGTMVDTWATVGSCAQIGKNVHLSGGVGIGGDHRGQLLYRRTLRSGRGRDRRGKQRDFDGRFPRPEHPDPRPGERADPLRPDPGGLGRRFRKFALARRQIRPLLRGHCKKS
jgi:hypothetical protein